MKLYDYGEWIKIEGENYFKYIQRTNIKQLEQELIRINVMRAIGYKVIYVNNSLTARVVDWPDDIRFALKKCNFRSNSFTWYSKILKISLPYETI